MKLSLPTIRSGDTIQLPPGVCQCGPYELVLTDLNDVVVQGWPDTELVIDTAYPIIGIIGGSNITLRNVRIRGPGPLHSSNSIYAPLVSLTGAYDGLHFENVGVLDMPNHGIADLDTRVGRNVDFIRCYGENGGNYGNNTGLDWDGAVFAMGVKGVHYSYCRVKKCIRAFEVENPRGDADFSIDHCYVSECSHVAAWVTPTGFETNTAGQVFTGSITNCVFENGVFVAGGGNPSGIVITGGQEIVVSNNIVRGFPNGSGIQARADHAPLSTLIFEGNIIRGCQVGMVFAAGIEGVKATADTAMFTGNIISGAQEGCELVTDGATNVTIL